MNARLPRGVRLGGSVDTGRTISNDCFIVDSPMQLTSTPDHNAAYLSGNAPVLGVGTVSSANPTYCHEEILREATCSSERTGRIRCPTASR